MEYHQSRLGLKVLQQKIDDSITAHEAQLEQVSSSPITLSVILNLIFNYSILLISITYEKKNSSPTTVVPVPWRTVSYLLLKS